jgi:PKD repeat protein
MSPTYVFYLPGIYTITLSATNLFGTDTEQKIEYITVTEGNTFWVPLVFNTK